MELHLDEDDETRPECLTLNFLTLLMVAENKRKGIFQLLSFKLKKQLVYSTKISDGFFEVKLMMVQQAAKQLSEGYVREGSILQGWVRNHGDGMLIVREKMRYWSCVRIVGTPLPWRMKRQNVNHSGSNLIIWNAQEGEKFLPQEVKGRQAQSSKIQIEPLKEQQKANVEVMCLNNQQILQRIDQPQSNSFQSLTQTQSLEAGPKFQNNNSPKSGNYQQMAQKNKLQNKQLHQIPEQIVDQRPNPDNKTQRMDCIMSFLFDSDDQQTIEYKASQNIATKLSHNIQISQRQNNIQHHPKSHPLIDLKFIFSALSEEEPHFPQKRQGQEPYQVGEDSDDEVFIEWLNNKKASRSDKTKTNTPMPQSVLKKRQQMYNQLMNSPDQGQKESQQSFLNQPVKGNVLELNSQLEGFSSLSLQNIYYGIYPRNSLQWYALCIVRCVGEISSKNYVNAIIADETNEYLINVVFLNFDSLTVELEEGCPYRIGRGIIKPALEHEHWNTSHCVIQFDCLKILIQKMQSLSYPKEASSNYSSIQKIYDRQEGQNVNVFGIIKNIRNISTKNGLITNHQIVDPISRYSISLTQFDSQLTPESIPNLINAAITVYNAAVSSYKGKKTIVTRPKSIIKLNWLPLSAEGQLVREWLQKNTNRIEELVLNLIGFTECETLSQIASVADSQVFVKNVTVLDINQRYTYLACIKCFKKVQDGRCRTCGKRQQHEIIERLFVRGNIADHTTVIPALWDNSIAQSIQSEGFHSFYKKWVLKKVSIWLQKGTNDSLTIVKAELLQPRLQVYQLFDFIKSRLL